MLQRKDEPLLMHCKQIFYSMVDIMCTKSDLSPGFPAWSSHPKENHLVLANLQHLSWHLQGQGAQHYCSCHPLHHAAKAVCSHHCPHGHHFQIWNPFHFQALCYCNGKQKCYWSSVACCLYIKTQSKTASDFN